MKNKSLKNKETKDNKVYPTSVRFTAKELKMLKTLQNKLDKSRIKVINQAIQHLYQFIFKKSKQINK